MHVPRARNVPCWHPSGVGVAAHLVRTFVAKGSVKHVTTLIAVSGVAVECHTTRVCWRYHIIGVAPFDGPFEVFVNVERHLTRIVTQARTLERVALAFDALHFRTCKKVHDVRICKGMVVVGRCAQVVIAHPIVALMVQTAIGQHRERHLVRVGWVVVKVLVGLADDAVRHGTIGHCLIGIVLHVVLLRRGHVLKGTQSRQLQPLYGLVLQL